MISGLVGVLVATQGLLAETWTMLCGNLTGLLASTAGLLMDLNAIVGKVIGLLTS